MSKQYTLKDVAEHKTTETGLWLVVDGSVYEMKEFQHEHPGGARIIQRSAGKDASKQFWKYHNDTILKKYGAKLKVGEVKEEAKL